MTAVASKPSLFSLKNKRTMPVWLAAPAAYLTKAWAATCRVSVVDPAGCYDAGRFPLIYAVWHNRIPLLGSLLKRDMRNRFAVLISGSRDGNYGAAVVRHLGLLQRCLPRGDQLSEVGHLVRRQRVPRKFWIDLDTQPDDTRHAHLPRVLVVYSRAAVPASQTASSGSRTRWTFRAASWPPTCTMRSVPSPRRDSPWS